MSRPRKNGPPLPLRVEARVWKDGKTTTYRYLAPTGEKVYLGTDLAQALAVYRHLTHRHPGPVSAVVSNAADKHRNPEKDGPAHLVRFHARAVLNAVGVPPYSHGKRSVPKVFRSCENDAD